MASTQESGTNNKIAAAVTQEITSAKAGSRFMPALVKKERIAGDKFVPVTVPEAGRFSCGGIEAVQSIWNTRL